MSEYGEFSRELEKTTVTKEQEGSGSDKANERSCRISRTMEVKKGVRRWKKSLSERKEGG